MKALYLALGLLGLAVSTGYGQEIVAAAPKMRVAVVTTEQNDAKPIEALLRQGFANISDVAPVSLMETPELVVRVVAVCTPSCPEARGYIIGILAYSPFSTAVARDAIAYALANAPDSARGKVSPAMQEHLAAVLGGADLDRWHLLTVGAWEVQEIAQRAQELVAFLDNRCLERRRLSKRADAAYALGQHSLVTTLMIEMNRRKAEWIC